MRRIPAFLGALLFTLSSLAATIQDVVDQISQTSYSGYLNDALYTHSGSNRGLGGTEHDLARASIQSTFTSFGLSTTLDDFTYGGGTYYNVVATLPGTGSGVYVVGAHYDSAYNPGADDNASGVAGVLEIARALSQYSFQSTLVFVAFDREEQGLIGSTAYVQQYATADYRGMISLDMIAFNPAGADHDSARAYSYSSGSNVLRQELADALLLYGGLTPGQGTMGRSDHEAFDRGGIPAVLLIEPYETNGNYHRATDSVDTSGYLDYGYATSMTRSAAGFIAEQATLVPEPTSLALIAVTVIVVARRPNTRTVVAARGIGRGRR